MSWYASIRRSRRKGQCVRLASTLDEIARDGEHLFAGAALGEETTTGIGHEAAAPELDAARSGLALVADPVDRADVDSVGDGVAALDRLPGRLLLGPVLFLLGGKPADRGGIEEDLGPAHGGEPRRLGIPLVPADEHADAAVPRVPGPEAEVARREVELLVVLRVVRDVHLPVLAEILPVRVDDGGGVVVESLGALLEERGDDHHPELPRERHEPVRRRAGDRLGQLEVPVVLGLAEVLAAEELLQADDLGALLRRLAHPPNGLVQVLLRVGTALHLDQPDRHRLAERVHVSKIMPEQDFAGVIQITWPTVVTGRGMGCVVGASMVIGTKGTATTWKGRRGMHTEWMEASAARRAAKRCLMLAAVTLFAACGGGSRDSAGPRAGPKEQR